MKMTPRNYLSSISITSDLSHAEPDQRGDADDDSIPGKGREAVARHDRQKRLDHRPGDDERHKGADGNQAEVIACDRVAMLEQLKHGGARQRRQRQEKAEL